MSESRWMSLLNGLELMARMPQEGNGAAGAEKLVPVLQLDAGALRMAKGFYLLGCWRGHEAGALPAFQLTRETVSSLHGTKVPHVALRLVQRDCGVSNVDGVFAEIHGLDEESIMALVAKPPAHADAHTGAPKKKGVGCVQNTKHGTEHGDTQSDGLSKVHTRVVLPLSHPKRNPKAGNQP